MKFKNFIKRGLAGLLSVLILLGDVGTMSAYALDTTTEIVETTAPLVQTDTVQLGTEELTLITDNVTDPVTQPVSEVTEPAITDAEEDNTKNKENTTSPEDSSEEQEQDSENTREGVSEDPADETDPEQKDADVSDEASQQPEAQSPAAEPEVNDQSGVQQEEYKDPSALSVSALSENPRYATANVSTKYSVSITGGTAPYQVKFSVKTGNAVCSEQAVELAMPGNSEFSFTPALFGEHFVELSVTDALGAVAEHKAVLPVSSGEKDDYDAAVSYITLSGDWGTDVMNFALSQIGAGEKQSNFIIDENNTYHYYTMYGDWYGDAYADWSAIFAAFCLGKAAVPTEAVPVDKDAEKMLAAVTDKGLFKAAADYEPVPGDVAFLSENRVGIVSVAGNGEVYIISGDSDNYVKQLVLKQDDAIILGYVSLAEAYTLYTEGPAEDATDAAKPEEPKEENTEEKPEEPEVVAPAVPLPESVEMSVFPAASKVGDTVTFSAILPADIDPDSLVYSWQISPDGLEWNEMDSTDVPSYDV